MNDSGTPDFSSLKKDVIEALKENHIVVPKYAIWVVSTAIAIGLAGFGISGCFALRETWLNTAKDSATDHAKTVATEEAEKVAKDKAGQAATDIFTSAINSARETAKTTTQAEAKLIVQQEARDATANALDIYLKSKTEKDIVDALQKKDTQAEEILASIKRTQTAIGQEDITRLSTRIDEAVTGWTHETNLKSSWASLVETTAVWRRVGESVEMVVRVVPKASSQAIAMPGAVPGFAKDPWLLIDLPDGVEPDVEGLPFPDADVEGHDAGSALFISNKSLWVGRCLLVDPKVGSDLPNGSAQGWRLAPYFLVADARAGQSSRWHATQLETFYASKFAADRLVGQAFGGDDRSFELRAVFRTKPRNGATTRATTRP